jgi:hypothetical protein
MKIHNHTWTHKFIKWQEYTLENGGDGRVPRDYKTTDGFALGNWQHQQSKLYKDGEMAAWRLDKIEQNDFPFKKQKCTFMYTPVVAVKELDKSFKEHGDVQLPKIEEYRQLRR